MVQFTQSHSKSHEPLAQRTLEQVINASLDGLQADLREMGIQVELEVERSVSELACQAHVEACLLELVQRAIAHCHVGGELSISACRTARGVEIEIAEGDSLTDDLPTNAFSRCQTWASAMKRSTLQYWGSGASADVYHTRCPQGGQAWTLVMSPRLARAKAA